MQQTILNPSDYISSYNHWDLLIQYLMDNPEKYPDFPGNSVSSKEILSWLLEYSKKSYGRASRVKRSTLSSRSSSSPKKSDTYDPRNLLKKALENIEKRKNDKGLLLDRINILRLILALRIQEEQEDGISVAVAEADRFLMQYMHTKALDARNLRECIFIWGLNNNLSASQILKLISDHVDDIDSQPIRIAGTPRMGRTALILQRIAAIDTWEEFNRFLDENVSFFSVLGYTRYFALFSDVCILSTYNETKETLTFFYNINNIPDHYKTAEAARAHEYSDAELIDDYYTRLFGLHSFDIEKYNNNYLKQDTINILTKVFPDVFISVSAFESLVRRNTSLDIRDGLFMLHMLEEMRKSDYKPVQGTEKDPETGDDVLVTPVMNFERRCNFYLNQTGFASLNRKVPFDCLILDVYENTVSNLASDECKDLFLKTFRATLTDIAITYDAISKSSAK